MGVRARGPRRHGRPVAARLGRRRTAPTWSSPGRRPRSSTGSPTAAPSSAWPASARPPTLARLESSKGFTRALAAQLGLPSPAYVRTESVSEALEWWHELGSPVVVKLDGLAAGKGVIVPATPGRHRGGDRRPGGPRPDRARGAPARPGVQPDGAVRRPHRPAAAAGPGPQAHRRGRQRPEHRRDGRLRAGAGALPGRRAVRPVRPARARPPRRSGHARTSACSTPG